MAKENKRVFVRHNSNDFERVQLKKLLNTIWRIKVFNFRREEFVETTQVLAAVFSEAGLLVKSTKKLEIAPGFKLHNFLTSICPKAFSERELDALHADSIELYFEKLNAGDEWGAMRVRCCMHAWMIWAVFGGAVSGIFAMIRGKYKSSE